MRQSESYSQKIAVKDGVEELSYGQATDKIKQVANGLIAHGLNAGDHIIISVEDCVDWPVIFLACVYKGIIPLPLSTTVGSDLFFKIADFVEAKIAIVSDGSVDKLSKNITILSRSDIRNFYITESSVSEPLMLDPDTPAYMSMSSGSTGFPKIAVFRQQTFYEILKLSPQISFGMNHDSVVMSVAKMSWCFGLHNSVTYVFGLGATAIVIPDPPAAPTIFEYANKFQPTIIMSSPSVIRRLVQPSMSKYSFPTSIKHFNSSGEHLPSIIYEQFLEKFGIKLCSCIGMMETCTNYAANTTDDHDAGTVGKSLPGCQVKLILESGDNSNIGEIYVSSPASAFYYYKNYEKTKQTFQGEWVKTGDLGYWNHNGNLVFAGRIDDVFKVNDLIVSPVDIESSILRDPTIDQVAVTKVKNKTGLNDLHAFIVPLENFNLTKFKEFLTQNLFSHQMPKQIHIVSNLAETMTFKKDRKTLSKSIEESVC